MRKLTKNQTYLKILLRNHPSEEAMFENNKIKEEHETMKF